jgi:hypothetical protein
MACVFPRCTHKQVPKTHAPNSATVAGKGHTRMTNATTTNKASVMC